MDPVKVGAFQKHGLLSAQVVVSAGDGAERPEEFRALLDGLLEEFDPHDLIEQALVERIAACYWRLRRAQRFEVGALRESAPRRKRPPTPPRSGVPYQPAEPRRGRMGACHFDLGVIYLRWK